MHVRDDLSIPADNVVTQTGAVTMTSGLMPVKVKRYPTASVDEKFLLFVEGDGPPEAVNVDMVASVGSVVVNEVTDPGTRRRRYRDSGLRESYSRHDGVAPANTETPDTESSVIFKGDFSFAMEVTLRPNRRW